MPAPIAPPCVDNVHLATNTGHELQFASGVSLWNSPPWEDTSENGAGHGQAGEG
jgi:hypothetical protein